MPTTDGDSLSGKAPSGRNGALSPLPSVSLSREHITEALSKSPDKGATLDLTHKHLTDVGEDGAEELATVGQDSNAESGCTVIRIALAHNRLTTLPMAFALLSRLRYLVLKSNNFTIFPDVLTVMPSLEILDISRNKIKRLPSQPGSLINLRVFSIMRNRIHRLPLYFTQFRHLNVFKADQNPLEWPPKTVMEPPGTTDDAHAMKEWIYNVQKWMENNRNGVLERKSSDDATPVEHSFDNDNSLDDISGSTTHSATDFSSHSRSFSVESDVSGFSEFLNLHSQLDAASSSPSSSRTPSRTPSRLRLEVPSSSRAGSNSASPLRSPGSYLPTPDESFTDEDFPPSASRVGRHLKEPVHSRNHSNGISRPGETSRHRIFAKKSMPDLRHDLMGPTEPLSFANHRNQSLPSPPHRQDSDSSIANTLADLHRAKVLNRDMITASPISVDRPAPSMDVERNTYFRRLSTLTSNTLAKTIPPALLTLIDGVRGILFAVSQVYQTLQHYTVFAIEERLSAVLLKVLDPASSYMHHLIGALDRFDSASRRMLPSPATCRAVIESCRDTVTVFGKAIGVLSLQLKVLATHDDIRYTRQMLLILYGAMAEIASAWRTIASQAEAVKPLLQEHPPLAKLRGSQTPTIRMSSASSSAESPIDSPMSAGLHIRPMRVGHDSTRNRVARRHAGSFSLKDVEIGKMLPSFVDPPSLSAGVVDASSTPTLRASRRPTALSPQSNGQASASSPSLPLRWDSHSRQNSQNTAIPASTSSPSLGLKTPSLDNLSSTNTLVDKEAIEAIRAAVDAAPRIWDMIEEILEDSQEAKAEFTDTLRKAREITDKLKINLDALTRGDAKVDRTGIREDAHIFVKIVVQLSNAVKTHGASHPLSSTLRNSLVKLTTATQDSVILLHVSSFSPAPNRAFSPMIAATTPSSAPEEHRQGAFLSRSRSTAVPAMTRAIRPIREPPKSALPHQTFRIPTPPRFGLQRSRSEEDPPAVPG